MTYIDTTRAIWENLYMVRVPALDATSVSFLKMHGTYITGDPRIDKANVNNWITTYLPISRMIELYKEGVTISVINPADTEKIYNAIDTHLNAWKYQLEHAINIGDAPLEDLIDMDKFANSVYAHAKYHIQPDTIDSLFMRRIHDRFKSTPNRMLKPLQQEEPTPIEDRSTHVSEFLKSRVFGARRY